MSLVKCPNCGRPNTSDACTSCPECGYNLKEHFEEELLKKAEQKLEEQKLQEEKQKKLVELEEQRKKEQEEKEQIKCPECGKSFLKKLNVCPNCGLSMDDEESIERINDINALEIIFKIRVLGLIGLILGMMFLWYATLHAWTDEYGAFAGTDKGIGIIGIISGIGATPYLIYKISKAKKELDEAREDYQKYCITKAVVNKRVTEAQEQLRKEHMLKMANNAICPYCNSRDTTKISVLNRATSVTMFGIASKKIGKQWHCNSCGSDF